MEVTITQKDKPCLWYPVPVTQDASFHVHVVREKSIPPAAVSLHGPAVHMLFCTYYLFRRDVFLAFAVTTGVYFSEMSYSSTGINNNRRVRER